MRYAEQRSSRFRGTPELHGSRRKPLSGPRRHHLGVPLRSWHRSGRVRRRRTEGPEREVLAALQPASEVAASAGHVREIGRCLPAEDVALVGRRECRPAAPLTSLRENDTVRRLPVMRSPSVPYLRRTPRFRNLSEENPCRETTVPTQRSVTSLSRLVAASLCAAVLAGLMSCSGGGAPSLRGDWDYYPILGAKPSRGLDALRRFGFAHFEKADTTGAWINRRSGARMERIQNIAVTGDSVVMELAAGTSIRAHISKDTIAGQYYRGKDPTQRVWFVRRSSPPVYEPNYRLWPGAVSDSTFSFTIDPAVPMKARDGTVLMNFVGTPSGKGPFGVVMERTPYLRVDTAAAVFWAARGFIYVKEDVRGRGGSGGVLDMNAMQESDGYDAVEGAAKLPGANGKVGMIGRSNPGLYAWSAAIAAPPHLAAIAPAVATADPLRIVPYIDMVFSPTIVPWLCLTQVRETMSDMSNLDVETAFNSLPVIASAEKSGCGRPQYWNDWFDHQKFDDYWRGLSIEARLGKVSVPVLGIGGWYDDARGTIRNYMAIDGLHAKPFQRLFMDAGAHKGIDYVNGSFGAQ